MSFWNQLTSRRALVNLPAAPSKEGMPAPMTSRSRRKRRQSRRSRLSRFQALESRRMLAAETEPNNVFANATVAFGTDTFEGTLSGANDVDIFRILLREGERFELDPTNFNADLFSPTLPPGLELFDQDENLLATSYDGSVLEAVAPDSGAYFVSISADNAFGTYVGEYAMRGTEFDSTSLNGRFGGILTIQDIEPNESIEGSFFQLSDLHTYNVSVDAGQTIAVNYAGLDSRAPATQILDSAGRLVSADFTGQGTVFQSENGGDFRILVQPIVDLPGFTDGYILNVGAIDTLDVASDSGSSFGDAVDWDLNSPAGGNDFEDQIVGILGSERDLDLFRFEIDTLGSIDFELEFYNGDAITRGGKSLRLYNQYGQILARSNSGTLSTSRPDAFAPGVYYLEVGAHSPIGAGTYAIKANFVQDFAPQRDSAIHFLDFDSDASYLGFDRQNPYAVTEGIPYYVGSFDAKYSPYDVEVTLEAPTEGIEHVAQGVGDFGDIGAGGFGSSLGGQRSVEGLAVTSARETSLNRLGYFNTETVYHEFGHAVGLPHARDVQSFMSYVGQAEYLSAGSVFSFDGTDSRVPGTEVNNQRNYLDFVLQSGAQVVAEEIGDDVSNDLALSLDPFLREMSIDHQPVQTIDVPPQPAQLAAGDFNGDGRDDIATLSTLDGGVSILLTGANGELQSPVSTDVAPAFGTNREPMSVGDLNNDGRDDLVIGVSQSNQIRVLLAGVGGVMALGTTVASASPVLATTLGDFDGDGNVDIAAALLSGSIGIFLGTGTGTFNASTSFPSVDFPRSIDTGDIDGDGDLDLVVGSEDTSSVAIHRNTGAGNFVRGNTVIAGGGVSGVTVGDFDQIGFADFAVTIVETSSVEIYRSIGDEFLLTQTHQLPNRPQYIESDDVDGDGDLDLLVGGFRPSSTVLLGIEEADFTRPIWVSGTSAASEVSLVAADLDNTGAKELISADFSESQLTVSSQLNENPENDKVVVFGSLDGTNEVDRYTFTPAGDVRWDIDIDAAEFQSPVDAVLLVRDGAGNIIARSDNATDRQSGIESVDPYVQLDFGSEFFIPAGSLTIEVTGRNGSSGNYRLKLTPGRAIETTAPRVIGISPANGSSLNTTNQILVLLDDIVDASSVNSSNFRVTDSSGARIAGNGRVNPLDSTVVWTANTPLAVGSYTVTLDGLTDLNGNELDGEVSNAFGFPEASGDGNEGGVFISTFAITSTDTSPAAVQSVDYVRDPYNRGQFVVDLSDSLSLESIREASFSLRGAGLDGVLSTGDDTLAPLDAIYDPIRAVTFNSDLFLYSRGIPDSGTYRIEGRVLDSAGLIVDITEEVVVYGTVPETALFQDASLAQTGLVGSYVNSSLRGAAAIEDWRATQTISGSRVDGQLAFLGAGSFGDQSDVRVTGGDDNDWEDFSVQWDGFLRVPQDGTKLSTRSEDGSRLLIDIDLNGVFGNTPDEIVDNNFGSLQSLNRGDLSVALDAGIYPVRVQYETTFGEEAMILEWVVPNTAVDDLGLSHGPSVIATSIAPGEHIVGVNADGSSTEITSFSVTFSSQIDTRTLTPENLFLRRSDDAQFFDAADSLVLDADGVIDWNASTQTATLTFAEPLRSGFYIFEANGDVGGIRNTAGQLLDGEFLTNNIPGNNDSIILQQTPSGDGIAGGTYRSTFSYSPPRLQLEVADGFISEAGGSTLVTLTRLFADTRFALTVSLTSSDLSELQTPTAVEIPAGLETVTFLVNAIDDTLFDGTQTVTLTASASNIERGSVDLNVTDFEQLLVSLNQFAISERGGVTELVLTRTDASSTQAVTISSDDDSEAIMPSVATFQAGERTITVPVTAIDDSILDGTQLVTIEVSGAGLINASTILQVTDFETLEMQLSPTSVSENGGVVSGFLRRTDPNGSLLVDIDSDPLGAFTTQTLVEFLPGQSVSLPFELIAVDNGLVDGTRNVSLTATALGYEPVTSSVEVTDFEQLEIVFTSPAPGAPVFDPETGTRVTPPPHISELDGEATIQVRRTDSREALIGSITINSADGISFGGASPFFREFTFQPGESLSDPIPVSAIDDDLLTGDRTFTFTASAEQYEDSTAELVVTDHEEIQASLVTASGAPVINGAISEDSEAIFLRIELPQPVPAVSDSPAGGSLTIQISSDQPQFLDFPEQVILRPGAQFVSVPVQPFDNDIVGQSNNLSLTVDALGYVSSSVGLEIIEDDVPMLTAQLILPTNQIGSGTNQVPENGGQATLVLTRNTIATTTVRLNTSLGVQFQWPETIQFERGFRRLEIPIETINNEVVDGDRSVDLIASATGHDPVTVTVGVLDDELAGVLLEDVNGLPLASSITLSETPETSTGLATKSISITLPAAPLSQVVYLVKASDRLSTSVSELIFTPSNWDQPQAVVVGVVDNVRTSGDETVQLTLEIDDAQSDAAFRSIPATNLDVLILDDDEAAIQISETLSTTFASELGLVDQFTLKLDTQPSAPVTLTFDTSEIDSVIVEPSSITFTPENWDTPQSLNVTTERDFNADLNDIGIVYIDVDEASQAVGYGSIGRRRISVIHVDAELSDLRIRVIGNQVALVDDTTNTTLIEQALFGGVFQTGNRGETLSLESGMGYNNLLLDTSGGDDRVIIGETARVQINGSEGYDTIQFDLEDFIFNPRRIASANNPMAVTLNQIEEIDTLENGVQTLVLDRSSVVSMTDERNELFLRIDPTDQLDLSAEWQVQTPEAIDGIPSHRLTAGDATLRIVAGATWQNPLNPLDVDRSGDVTPLDALIVINRLNAQGEPATSEPSDGGLSDNDQLFYYDVSGDGQTTAIDALRTINYLNSSSTSNRASGLASGSGESLEHSRGSYDVQSIVVSGLPTTDLSAASSIAPSISAVETEAGDWLIDEEPLSVIAASRIGDSPTVNADHASTADSIFADGDWGSESEEEDTSVGSIEDAGELKLAFRL